MKISNILAMAVLSQTPACLKMDFPAIIHLDELWSSEEKETIRSAFDDWFQASGGVAEVTIIDGWAHDWDNAKFRGVPGEANESKVVWKLNEEEAVSLFEAEGLPEAWGATWYTHAIVMATERFSGESNLSRIMKHEIGHLYGLDHEEQSDYPSVMNAHLVEETPDCIDPQALKAFCGIYDCPVWSHPTCE